MTSQIQEAVELTVGGLATVFVLLILLVVLLVLFRRLLAWGPVSRLVAEPPVPESDPAQRDRALASAIGVTIALAESGRGGRVGTAEEA
ncbi:MAG: OadG family protein [Dehalococcoidia bacterium]|nr:OadG family protein [Dehalococcoidia bacterium]